MLPKEAGEQHGNLIAPSAAPRVTTVETQTASTTASHNDQGRSSREQPNWVVYLYRAGNSVACKTGIMPPFHHHERGQRDGLTPLFLPVGAVGSALAVLHVACCLAQS